MNTSDKPIDITDPSPSDPEVPAASQFVLRSIRWLFAFEIAVLAFCGFYVMFEERWFSEAVWVAAGTVFVVLMPFWIVIEVLAYFMIRPAWRFWLLLLVATTLLVSCGYILPATLFGLEQAKFDTFHLLPIFAVIYLGTALLFVGVPSAIITWVFCLFKPERAIG